MSSLFSSPDNETPTNPNHIRLVLPVKSFQHGKQRLAAVLDAAARHELSMRLATQMVDSNHDLNPLVVTNDDEVANWAKTLNVEVHHPKNAGLNEAVSSASNFLRAASGVKGIKGIVIAHCDIAFPRSLDFVAYFDGFTLIPDRHGEGTNVMCLPLDVEFTFAYGPHSFGRHHRAALATGRAVRVVNDELLGIDVDTPQDLALVHELHATTIPPAITVET